MKMIHMSLFTRALRETVEVTWRTGRTVSQERVAATAHWAMNGSSLEQYVN